MHSSKRTLARTVISAAILAATTGFAFAEGTLKVGLLSILEGPFAVPGQDGIRGAEAVDALVAGREGSLTRADDLAGRTLDLEDRRRRVAVLIGETEHDLRVAARDAKCGEGLTDRGGIHRADPGAVGRSAVFAF